MLHVSAAAPHVEAAAKGIRDAAQQIGDELPGAMKKLGEDAPATLSKWFGINPPRDPQ